MIIISKILKEFLTILELKSFEIVLILFFSLLLIVKFLKLNSSFLFNLLFSISVLCLFFLFIVLSLANCILEFISFSLKIYSYLSYLF